MRSIAAPCLAVLSAWLALSGPVPAQLTEAQAVKQFKAAVKPLLELLLPDLVALQHDGAFASVTAEVFGAVALQQILLDLAAGDTPDGVFPATFYANSGGAWDDFEASVRENHAKAWAKLEKRAAKVVKAAAKVGFALTLRIDPPSFVSSGVSSVNEGDFSSTGAGPMTIDVAIGGSALAAEGDGVLLLAGRFNQFDVTSVTVTLTTVLNGDPADVPQDIPTAGATLGSWGVVIDGGGSLAEGNYQVRVSQLGDDACIGAVTGAFAMMVGIP